MEGYKENKRMTTKSKNNQSDKLTFRSKINKIFFRGNDGEKGEVVVDNTKFLDEISGKHINFLIGAGASVGIVPTLWVTSIQKSFEELLASKDYSDRQKRVLYYVWFNLWIRKTRVLNSEGIDVKVIENYTKFTSFLNDFIGNEGFDKHKRINLFTTNYDTLFEYTFDKYTLKNRLTYFNDGSRGFIKKYMSTEDFYINVNHSGINDGFQRSIPTFNLIKMHGSVTWSKSNQYNKIEVNLKNEVFDDLVRTSDEITSKISTLVKKGELDAHVGSFFLLENLENNILKGSISENDLKVKIDSLTEVMNKDFEDYMDKYSELPIVNPTKKKFSQTVFEQHYYQMLRLLSFELERKNSVLIVFGFSFADEHILEIVRRSMVNPYLKVYVIAYDKKSKESIETLLGEGIRVDYLPKERENQNTETLGNFDFLNSLFGGNV